jgi:MoxR-like ATPase
MRDSRRDAPQRRSPQRKGIRVPTRPTTGGLRLLRDLGIVGWDGLEPVILAALATEAPLLLIGRHGSAKTLVLTRLAEALGLAHRHYNASLLNFDDLVGFPLPENGKLVYLQTPATIWDAESVLFDEVSRCRPELQNKLFPIVHEKIVQGVRLERLRHRWAAMNPPPSADGRSDAPEYAGAEPLDMALADRFAFIISVPSLEDLRREDQLALLGGIAPVDDAAERLRPAIDRIRTAIDATAPSVAASAAHYVQAIAGKLADAGHPISTRRAVQLTRNIVAIAAALDATGESRQKHEDALYTALRFSLPDAAWGAPVSTTTILTAHRAAWELVRLDDEERKGMLLERDPVRRIARVLASSIAGAEAGQTIADAFSSLPRLARLATAAVLAPVLSKRTDLPAATIEPIARDFSLLSARHQESITVGRGGADWRRQILSADLPKLERGTARGRYLTNAAIVLLQEDDRFELKDLAAAYDHASDILQPRRRGKERAA